MKKWSFEDLKSKIASHGLVISEIKEIQHGQQIVLSEGTRANWYSSGKIVIQGKDSEEKNLANS